MAELFQLMVELVYSALNYGLHIVIIILHATTIALVVGCCHIPSIPRRMIILVVRAFVSIGPRGPVSNNFRRTYLFKRTATITHHAPPLNIRLLLDVFYSLLVSRKRRDHKAHTNSANQNETRKNANIFHTYLPL